jgi:hypothetical protein
MTFRHDYQKFYVLSVVMKLSKSKPYLKPSEPQSGMIVILKPETDLKRWRFGGFKSFFLILRSKINSR